MPVIQARVEERPPSGERWRPGTRLNRRSLVCLVVGLLALNGGGCRFASRSQNSQGVALYQQGNYQAASQRFQQALNNDPKNADAYYNLASVMHATGKQTNDRRYTDQAEVLYNRCLDLDGNHAACYRSLAVLLAENNRSSDAFRLMQNWVRSSPQVADARIELARLYQEFGDTANATASLQDALQINHQDARAWAALAQLREQAGDYQQALANYQQAYALNNNPQVAQRLMELGSRYGGLAQDTWRSGGTRLGSPNVITPRY